MSSPEDLERVLPRLRRIARATTNDKQIADLCVERALIGVVNSINAVEKADTLLEQTNLYRAVEKQLEAIAGDAFDKQQWRALILVVIEELSVFEVGRILDIEPRKVRDLVGMVEVRSR